MTDIVHRANAAVEGVTPGPWVVNSEGWATVSHGSDSVVHGYFEGDCGNCGDRITDSASVAISWEDVQFIAAARTLVPDLAAEVDRLSAILAKVQATAEYWRGDSPRLPQALRQGADTLLAVLAVDQ